LKAENAKDRKNRRGTRLLGFARAHTANRLRAAIGAAGDFGILELRIPDFALNEGAKLVDVVKREFLSYFAPGFLLPPQVEPRNRCCRCHALPSDVLRPPRMFLSKTPLWRNAWLLLLSRLVNN
jgi:hypothetical protein